MQYYPEVTLKYLNLQGKYFDNGGLHKLGRKQMPHPHIQACYLSFA